MDIQKSGLDMTAIANQMKDAAKQSANTILLCKNADEEEQKKAVLEQYFLLTVKLDQFLRQSDQLAATWAEQIHQINLVADQETAVRLQVMTEAYFAFRNRIGQLLDQAERESYRDAPAFRLDAFYQLSTRIQYACSDLELKFKS